MGQLRLRHTAYTCIVNLWAVSLPKAWFLSSTQSGVRTLAWEIVESNSFTASAVQCGAVALAMTLPKTKSYIASNPRFSLTTDGWPKLQEGQMEIVFRCLQPYGSQHSLEDLVRACIGRNYKSTFKDPNTDIRKSILYHLNLLQEAGSIREVL
jgi:hypothetical protein